MSKDNTTDNSQEGEYRFLVEFYVFRVSESYIAFCPVLEITASGKDNGEAVVNFHEEFDFYIQECLEMGILIEDMLDHGWIVKGSQLISPTFAEQMKNDTLRELVNAHIDYEKIVFPATVFIE